MHQLDHRSSTLLWLSSWNVAEQISWTHTELRWWWYTPDPDHQSFSIWWFSCPSIRRRIRGIGWTYMEFCPGNAGFSNWFSKQFCACLWRKFKPFRGLLFAMSITTLPEAGYRVLYMTRETAQGGSHNGGNWWQDGPFLRQCCEMLATNPDQPHQAPGLAY